MGTSPWGGSALHMGTPAKDWPRRAHLGWVGKPRAAGRGPGGHPCVLGDSSTPRCPVTCSSQPTHPLLRTSGMVPDGDGHSTLARLRWEMAPPCPHSPATSPQHSTVGIPTLPMPQGLGERRMRRGRSPAGFLWAAWLLGEVARVPALFQGVPWPRWPSKAFPVLPAPGHPGHQGGSCSARTPKAAQGLAPKQGLPLSLGSQHTQAHHDLPEPCPQQLGGGSWP